MVLTVVVPLLILALAFLYADSEDMHAFEDYVEHDQ